MGSTLVTVNAPEDPVDPEEPVDSTTGAQPLGIPVFPRAQPNKVLFQVGDIMLTDEGLVTGSGVFPLIGTRWGVSQQWSTQRVTPGWVIFTAILMTLLTFWICGLGFLFLLLLSVKEDRTTGNIIITLSNGSRRHMAPVPVRSEMEALNLIRWVSGVDTYFNASVNP